MEHLNPKFIVTCRRKLWAKTLRKIKALRKDFEQSFEQGLTQTAFHICEHKHIGAPTLQHVLKSLLERLDKGLNLLLIWQLRNSL